MPFHLPFNMPYFFRPNYRYTYHPQYVKRPENTNITLKQNLYNNPTDTKSEDSDNKQNNRLNESSEYFFEILGLKLYFDDVLIICLLYFLYTEGVQDQELFICLILLLIS